MAISNSTIIVIFARQKFKTKKNKSGLKIFTNGPR
jgi:hypothetical protein